MLRCYIIGYPLKNPRSVILWKKFFKKKKINSSMKPLELTKNKLRILIKQFKKDKKFLASAVTMPFKNQIYQHIIPGDKVAKTTKAINCNLKKNNKIYGYNTDILALLSLIKKKYFRNTLILGLGGVGQALYNYLKEDKKVKLFALSRSKKGKHIYKNLKNIDLSKINLVINCTPLGSSLKKKFNNKSPISLEDLKRLNKNSYIFDIIYKPKITKLISYSKKLKFKYSNGVKMNTKQADIALNMLYKNL